VVKERIIQNQSEHTISAYQRDLTDFFHFCELKQLQLHDIEASDLREYLAARVEKNQFEFK
jgi:integrase/recombinase XerC